MSDPKLCLLGLDLGTSAIKGVLVDQQGRVLAEAGADTVFHHPHEGFVEVDPHEHYEHVCGVLRSLAEAAPGPVAALAMAAAAGNTLLTDSAGAPLTPIINWMDGRAQQQPPQALAGLTEAEVRQVTGWPCRDSFPLAHLAWLREQRPEVYRAAGHYAMDTDWLLYRLTGQWVMDHSTATTQHLQDQVAGTRYAPFLQRLNLPPEKLSPLAAVGAPVGPLTPGASRDTGLAATTLVVTGCFDHPAAARAMGVLAPGELMLSCGTSWVGFTPVRDRAKVLAAQMLCDPFLSGPGGPWGGMFSVPHIGPTIDWYIDHLIAPGETDRLRVFNETAAAAPAGACGLVIDLREPPQPLTADRTLISRAVMESAVRLLSDKLLALGDHGLKFARAVMVGGPSASALWTGLLAAATGLQITVGGRSAGARGAALLAGIGAGIYSDEYEALARWDPRGPAAHGSNTRGPFRGMGSGKCDG